MEPCRNAEQHMAHLPYRWKSTLFHGSFIHIVMIKRNKSTRDDQTTFSEVTSMDMQVKVELLYQHGAFVQPYKSCRFTVRKKALRGTRKEAIKQSS